MLNAIRIIQPKGKDWLLQISYINKYTDELKKYENELEKCAEEMHRFPFHLNDCVDIAGETDIPFFNKIP